MTSEWVQPQSSAAEFLRLRDEALEKAVAVLRAARGYGPGSVSSSQLMHYRIAKIELAFVKYWERRAKDLQKTSSGTLSESIEPQDPNSE